MGDCPAITPAGAGTEGVTAFRNWPDQLSTAGNEHRTMRRGDLRRALVHTVPPQRHITIDLVFVVVGGRAPPCMPVYR